ncbi:MAG TPA: CPBP family intramembrane metalloprotease [Firmicutes bacterium]|nr:CPBP family intramembrane metalloprotease [Candidatus Fermentithermobacillaceae bacterium]
MGRKLFDAASTTRAIVASSIVFSLSHVGSLLYAVSTLERVAAIANLLSAFIIGIFLGVVYSRSRNLLSVVALHWWFNLQNRLMQYLAFLTLS